VFKQAELAPGVFVSIGHVRVSGLVSVVRSPYQHDMAAVCLGYLPRSGHYPRCTPWHCFGIHPFELDIFFLQDLQPFGIRLVKQPVVTPQRMQCRHRNLLLLAEFFLAQLAASALARRDTKVVADEKTWQGGAGVKLLFHEISR
jgi:hypothetical protein